MSPTKVGYMIIIMVSLYSPLRGSISLIIDLACLSKHISKHFNTHIFSVEADRSTVLSNLDKSIGIDQIHLFIDKDDHAFATSNRICFVKKDQPARYFKIKYKKSNRQTEYDVWKKLIYEDDLDTDIYPIIPTYFIQSFVDIDLKFKIENLLKKGLSVEKCIELIENKKTDFDIDDYIRGIAYAHIRDILDAIDSNQFKERVIQEGPNTLHWAYVDWMNVRNLGIIL